MMAKCLKCGSMDATEVLECLKCGSIFTIKEIQDSPKEICPKCGSNEFEYTTLCKECVEFQNSTPDFSNI